MQTLEIYQKEFSNYLEQSITVKDPASLYEPIQYILSLGGKQLRPVLTLLTADIFDGNYRDALDAALAIEIFHNFSLIHDDIMDDAPLRRGEQTVHEKWDLNTGILSGDAMLISAYRLFESYKDEKFKTLTSLFSKTALEVCEGQQYDMDFETQNDVSIPEYLKMIEYKTAVLVASAMKMGAIIANASIEDQNSIYSFGINLGIAFQLQDDYLDAFGNPETFGKQVGGDIIENKKTYLYLKALEFSNEDQKNKLQELFTGKHKDNHSKIEMVKQLFVSTSSTKATIATIENYTNKAFSALETLQITKHKKKMLIEFGNQLINRKV